MAHAMNGRSSRRASETWEFRLYVAAMFPIFLVIAIVARLLPRSWRPFSSDTRRSVFGDARAATFTVLPFVFRA